MPRSIREAGELLRARKLSALELAELALARSHADRHNAWLHLSDDHARAQARAADARITAGDAPLLTGIPWACKDIIGTKKIPTTAGSRILEGYIPPYSATVVERLDAQGSVMVGKTNLDEFAMGSSNENSAFGAVKNPWREDRVPGGSSGGSAVAVAAGEVLFSLGTDTGGSIRQPAALTGVVGMKPTYGRVPRWGVVAFASSLDQIGPFARSARDAALLLQAVAGPDPRDATCSPRSVPDYSAGLNGSIKGLRIGVPKEYWVEGTQPGVVEAVRADIEKLREIAQNIEAQIIRVPTGAQDYYPPMYGGVCAIELNEAGITRRAVNVDLDEFNQRFVLAYTGAPRNSARNRSRDPASNGATAAGSIASTATSEAHA